MVRGKTGNGIMSGVGEKKIVAPVLGDGEKKLTKMKHVMGRFTN